MSSVESKPVLNTPRLRKRKMRSVLQLIPHCSYILQMLYSNQNKKVNVNEIARHLYQIGKDTEQTGLRYKQNTLNAIKLMQKAEIITKNKDGNHTQTKFIELGPLGREFGRLLESGNSFHIAYSQLREKITGNFNLSERSHEKVRENLLRSKGWADEDISSYEKTSDDLITFERSLLPLMVQGLVNRYILILSRFNPTKNAKEILDAILTDTLNKGIFVMLENIATNNSSGGDILHTEDLILELGPYGGLLFDCIDDLGSFLICNKFIKEEIKNAIASLFSLFNPPKRYVERHIEEVNSKYGDNPQQQILLHLYKELNKLS